MGTGSRASPELHSAFSCCLIKPDCTSNSTHASIPQAHRSADDHPLICGTPSDLFRAGLLMHRSDSPTQRLFAFLFYKPLPSHPPSSYRAAGICQRGKPAPPTASSVGPGHLQAPHHGRHEAEAGPEDCQQPASQPAKRLSRDQCWTLRTTSPALPSPPPSGTVHSFCAASTSIKPPVTARRTHATRD